MIPLPFTCLHGAYTAGVPDDHGDTTSGWAAGVSTPCIWWPGASTEPFAAPTGSEQVQVDITVVIDSAVVVDHRDRFTVDGQTFDVVGQPKSWDHGPWWAPNRQAVELQRVPWTEESGS